MRHCNVNSLWGEFAIEVLRRLGLRHALLSPGSRSTPLAVALARNAGIETLPVLDERSAAFYALGLARQTGRPVLLVCTSGTAAANYLPAIIEARESGVPLLILTADRPPEMRQCASGQTIDQLKLFGDNVLHFHEMMLPEAVPGALRYLRQTLSSAMRLSLAPRRGPVHLNCPFRDPLAPDPDTSLMLDFDPTTLLDGIQPAHDGGVAVVADVPLLSQPAFASSRGLVVAGSLQPDDPEEAAASVFEFARRRGWPVLCDVLGPWRSLPAPEGVVCVSAYDSILRNRGLAPALAPDFVVQVGPLPTSKILREWLARQGCPVLVVGQVQDNLDPLHRNATQILAEPWMLNALTDTLESEEDAASSDDAPAPPYAAAWARLDDAARAALDVRLDACPFFFEGLVAREVFAALPTDTHLFIASSMPVRDAEWFARPRNDGPRVFFNRGANGIDGTLSSALGCAHGRRGVLLTGDLALLHDSNGFLAASRFKGHLSIVCINNAGGGIFGSLPVARTAPDVFEDYFAMPQSVDLKLLAAAHGVEHIAVESPAHLRTLLTGLPDIGVRLLEVHTDRRQDMDFRRQLFRETAEGLGRE